MKITQELIINNPAAGTSAISDNRTSTPGIISLLKAVVNTRLALFPGLATINTLRAYHQAKSIDPQSSAQQAQWLALIRQRLRQPNAQLLMIKPRAPFENLAQWLPAIPEPLLNDWQLHQLGCLALGLPVEQLNRFAGLQYDAPELYQLLLKEINQAAAVHAKGFAAQLLPQLSRISALRESLALLHPLLPTVIWSAQLLWQLRQQGVASALDSELKHQLHLCLTAVEGEHSPLSLSEITLFSRLNHWADKLLSDNRHPRQAEGALLTLTAPGWKSNSVLNMPANPDASLLVDVFSCHELLKPITGQYDFAVSCALRRDNSSEFSPSALSGTLFSRSLVIDEGDRPYARWQIENGPQPLLLNQVEIPARQSRTLALKQLAGEEDTLTRWPASSLNSVNPLLTGSTAARQLDVSATSQIIMFSRKASALPRQQEPATSAWPFGGVNADSRDGIAQSEPTVLTADEYYPSLQLQYREELSRYSQVTLSQHSRSVKLDKVMPLLQALQTMQQARADAFAPRLTLHPHPEWSEALKRDISEFIDGKGYPVLDQSRPINWESVDNLYAAWLMGSGLAKSSLENMRTILSQVKSPVWDVKSWFNNKINALVEAAGGDSNRINASTRIGVGVRIPAHQGRQSIPLPVVTGSWHPVGRYTLRDIFTREYLRGNYRYESLEFRFPASVSKPLQQAILQTDLQVMYMDELSETLAVGEVRAGMLALFKEIFARTFYQWQAENRLNPAQIDAIKIHQGLAQHRFYGLEWQGFKLNGLVFIPQDNAPMGKGVIFSVWDAKSWAVNIDLLATITVYGAGRASSLVARLFKSLPVPGQVDFRTVVSHADQIVINTSGHDKVEFSGKVFTRTSRVDPVAEKSLLQLVRMTHIDSDLLDIFAASLRLDMDYLIKSDAEHILDSAIEIFSTLATLVGVYVMPVLWVPARGISVIGAKLTSAAGSWQTSLAVNSALTIFPNLAKAITADRRDDARTALLDAMMGLTGEGSAYLIGKYFPRAITGIFKQGGKAIKLDIDQLPELVKQKLTHHANLALASVQADIWGKLGLSASGTPLLPAYSLPFTHIKAPAPVDDLWTDLTDFPQFLNQRHPASVHENPQHSVNMQKILQDYLQSKDHRVQIGMVLRWSDHDDLHPQSHYLLRVNSPLPQPGSPHQQYKDAVINYIAGGPVTGGMMGIVISELDRWLDNLAGQPDNQNCTLSIEWFAQWHQAQSRDQSLHNRQPMPLSRFTDTLVLRADWYYPSATRRGLNQIADLQTDARESLYHCENSINVRDPTANADRLSLNLGEQFAAGTLQPFNSLGEKLRQLINNPISQRPVALPGGRYRLIATDLRGISDNNNDTLTLTDFGAAEPLWQLDLIQSWAPEQIIEAASAAQFCSLYAPRIDEFLLEQTLAVPLPCALLRLQRLQDNARWLNSNNRHQRVPLIVAIKYPQQESQQIDAVVATSDILFVLTADEMVLPVREILSSLRSPPIPVSPLLTENAPSLLSTMVRGESYALYPDALNSQAGEVNDPFLPWLPVINLQSSGRFITGSIAEHLRQQTRADSSLAFLGDNALTVASLTDIITAQPGARIAFFGCGLGPGQPPLSHAMMMLDDGSAVGCNNQLIGGKGGWQKIYLATLNWIIHPQLGFVLQAGNNTFSLQIQTSPSQEATADSDSGGQATENADLHRLVAAANQYLRPTPPASAVKPPAFSYGWQAFGELYRDAGLLRLAKLINRLVKPGVNKYRLLNQKPAQMVRSLHELTATPPGSAMFFFEKLTTEPRMSARLHIMIMAENGTAIGVDNEIIGGEQGWSKQRLSNLTFHADTRQGLILEAENHQFWCIVIVPQQP